MTALRLINGYNDGILKRLDCSREKMGQGLSLGETRVLKHERRDVRGCMEAPSPLTKSPLSPTPSFIRTHQSEFCGAQSPEETHYH